MKTAKLLATSLLTVLASACSNQSPVEPTTPTTAVARPERVDAATAVRVRGDIVPSRLVAISLPKMAAQPVLSASSPDLPKRVFSFEPVIRPSTRMEFGRLVPPGAGTAVSVPIDAPAGARVIITTRDPKTNLPSVHLRDSSGRVIDRARDEASVVAVSHVPAAVVPAGTAASRGLIGTGRLAEIVKPEPALAAAASLSRRILSIDVPTKPGRVTIELPAAAVAAGVEIDVDQPNSAIQLSAAPAALNYGFGEVAEVDYTLTNGETPIDGATLSGVVELPNGERVSGLAFEAKGNGHYAAKVPLASADLKYIGVWHVRAKATGTVGGVEFERDMENGFGYAPAHAQMTQVRQPQIVRGKDDLIDEITVDVFVDSILDDRLGVAATLVFTGPDGAEHAVASAQTSADLKAGNSAVTLHFAAKDLALAQASGPFTVRDLSLVSHAYATTQHRLGRGLDLTTPAFAFKELRYPGSLSPAVDEMFERGDFQP